MKQPWCCLKMLKCTEIPFLTLFIWWSDRKWEQIFNRKTQNELNGEIVKLTRRYALRTHKEIVHSQPGNCCVFQVQWHFDDKHSLNCISLIIQSFTCRFCNVCESSDRTILKTDINTFCADVSNYFALVTNGNQELWSGWRDEINTFRSIWQKLRQTYLVINATRNRLQIRDAQLFGN